jgi:hypothetical protein
MKIDQQSHFHEKLKSNLENLRVSLNENIKKKEKVSDELGIENER